MMNRGLMIPLVSVSIVALGACSKQAAIAANDGDSAAAAKPAATPADPVQSALAAAPASISAEAAVMAPQPDGTMKVLRQGKNGWSCMPDNPATPGPDPMCMDANAMKWAEAWIGHKDPPKDNVGLMYMLSGGTDASNTDPYGQKPPEGKDWVKTGPHVMVVGADSLNRIYPGGEDPDTSKPYVMFGGTPYAHVMIPIG